MKTLAACLLPLSFLAGCSDKPVSPVSSEQVTEENSPMASTTVADDTEPVNQAFGVSKPKKDEPRLWQDREAASAIKALGYDDAYVYRWRNGAVEATVLFDADEGQKRWQLDSTRIPTSGGAIDAPRSSGVFVLALTRRSSGVHGCRTGATVSFDVDGENGAITYAEEGEIQLPSDSRLFVSSSAVKDNSAYLAKGSGENESKFLKISFSLATDEQ